MNNLTFGDESFGYYETIAGGAGAGAPAQSAPLPARSPAAAACAAQNCAGDGAADV
jgi:hypothetical protein